MEYGKQNTAAQGLGLGPPAKSNGLNLIDALRSILASGTGEAGAAAYRDHFQAAARMAAYLSSIIEAPDVGGPMNAGEVRYNNMAVDISDNPHYAFPSKKTSLFNFLDANASPGSKQGPYDPANIGLPLEHPFYGGAKMLVPASAGYAPGQGHTDPFQQEVYGYLSQIGHPVLGPSFEEVYGKPGIIGFGKR